MLLQQLFPRQTGLEHQGGLLKLAAVTVCKELAASIVFGSASLICERVHLRLL